MLRTDQCPASVFLSSHGHPQLSIATMFTEQRREYEVLGEI